MEKENEEIFKKTSKLFCKYGVKSVSMDDIARELGISKKTLYQHVKDKKELIESSLDYIKYKHLENVEAIGQKGLNAIEEILETHRMVREAIADINPIVDFEMRKYYPNLHRKLNERHSEKARNLMRANIEKGIAEGLFRNDFNIDLITMLHYGRMMAIIDLEEQDLPIDWAETIHQIIIYHLRGICNRKGIEVLEENITKSHQ